MIPTSVRETQGSIYFHPTLFHQLWWREECRIARPHIAKITENNKVAQKLFSCNGSRYFLLNLLRSGSPKVRITRPLLISQSMAVPSSLAANAFFPSCKKTASMPQVSVAHPGMMGMGSSVPLPISHNCGGLFAPEYRIYLPSGEIVP